MKAKATKGFFLDIRDYHFALFQAASKRGF